MNRPLAAFGALMTFLVLAMFAVSSTGRSTSVQAVRPKRLAMAQGQRSRPKEAQLASAGKTLKALGGSAGREMKRISRLTGECEARNCGLVMTERYLTSLTSLKAAVGEQTELATVRIVVATDTMEAWRTPEPMGCLAYYDAEYDRIVYGICNGRRTEEQKNQEPKEERLGVCDEEQAALFFGLVGKARTSLWKSKLAAFLTETTIGWEGYAEWIDKAIKGRLVSADTAKTTGRGGSVRSGDWLRHSAALSLYRVGALLQAAAIEVEQAGETSAGRTPEGMAR